MDILPTGILILILILCLVCSAFFSASETAMMSINRYKLTHWADEGKKSAKLADGLLKETDKLLGTILLGNNFVNILATSLGTILGIRLFGDIGILIATIVLTFLVLVFAEIAPKTLAAIFPDKVALPASKLLQFFMSIFSPFVWSLNKFVALCFKPFGIENNDKENHLLTLEELKTVVLSSSTRSVSPEHQNMLIGVLELEDVSVDEVMVPRNEIQGIDLDDPWEHLVEQIDQNQHSRLVVYRGHLDQVQGILHIRDVINLYKNKKFSLQGIIDALHPCTFIPENTLLRQQLLNFRQQKQRSGLVVDEYGDIQGMVTLEDILTYIVGDISDKEEDTQPEIIQRQDRVYDIDGGVSLRTLNRELGLKLTLEGPNTLSGLIVETLGNFPKEGTEVKLDGCLVRVKSFSNGVVEDAEIELVAPKKHL